jgi:erythritol kinase (D-erythritol 1-phosphate-forming)
LALSALASITREEAGAAGAVMIAAVQQKLYPDMAAAVKAWIDPMLSELTQPELALGKIYDGIYPLYRDMRIKLRPAWRGLGELKRSMA